MKDGNLPVRLRWSEGVKLFRSRWKGARPTVFFFIALFLMITVCFGSAYAMAVSGTTTLFQVRRNREHTLGDYVRLFFMCMLLCVLAMVATRSGWLCVLLNLSVPFLLVFFQSSQFAPKGYIGYAMTFVFLELRPPAPEEMGTQLLAVAACTAALILALAGYGWWRGRTEKKRDSVGESLDRLAALLKRMAEEGGSDEVRKELYGLEQSFHRMGYRNHRLPGSSDPQKLFYNMFAILFQRAVYLVSDAAWQEEVLPPERREALEGLAGLVRAVRAAQTAEERAAVAEQIQAMLADTPLPEGRLRIFYRSFLHRMLLLLRHWREVRPVRHPLWRGGGGRELWRRLRERFSLERFEMRFALRLSVVLTVSCTISLLWDFEHTYWFPLHAFLLIQPSYEESAHRMVTRPIGTALGCLLVFVVYPLLPGVPGVFVFSFVMISLMYCCTPGTWVHPIFSTAFAVTMASLTMEDTVAIGLRIFYLLLAVLLVLVINRFFVPTRREKQFRSNLHTLTHLHATYWDMVSQGLGGRVDPAFSSEILTEFHLVYDAAMGYVLTLPQGEERTEASTLLLTLWNMFSELEQVHYLLQAGAIPPEQGPGLSRLARTLCVEMDRPGPPLDAISLEAGMEEGDLGYVLGRYLASAHGLSRQLAGVEQAARERE